MRAATFLGLVEQAAGVPRDEAERAVHATLQTLAERITLGEAEDIAALTPREFRSDLTSSPGAAEGFPLEEFIQRVADREGVDRDTARRHVEGVFAALAQAVAPGELRDMAAQLSRDYAPLLELARSRIDPALPRDRLVARVAELLEVDEPEARRAAQAVLETLAIRISEGEVEDLIARLPADLTPALERGLAQSRRATKMSLQEFLARVAKLEGVEPDEAERHARAVFAALRELVPDKEIYDVESELPREYAPLFSNVV